MKRKIRKYNARHDGKLRERENKEKEERKEEKEKIRPFSLQSALGIVASTLMGSVIVPFLLSFAGIKDAKTGILIGNIFVTSFGFTWVRHFIDSKKGFSGSFWIQYAIFGVIFGIISYFWFFRMKLI